MGLVVKRYDAVGEVEPPVGGSFDFSIVPRVCSRFLSCAFRESGLNTIKAHDFALSPIFAYIDWYSENVFGGAIAACELQVAGTVLLVQYYWYSITVAACESALVNRQLRQIIDYLYSIANVLQ